MVDRPNWSTGGAGGDGAAPNPSPPAVVPPASGQVTHPDWDYAPHQIPAAAGTQVAAPQEEIVAGVGYAQSLVQKFSRQPEGFEVNDARLVNAAADLLERPDTPKELEAAFDELPVSLQTKAYETLWANAVRSLEELYAKLKPKLTLSEAAEAAKLMARLTKPG